MNQNKLSDLLELAMVLAFLFLIIVIYVPVAIWAEEREFEKKSHFNMQNIYDIGMFYEQLTGSYSLNFFEAMNVVNSARVMQLVERREAYEIRRQQKRSAYRSYKSRSR